MTCCWGFIPGRNVSTPRSDPRRSEAITLSAEHKAKLSDAQPKLALSIRWWARGVGAVGEFRKFIDDEAVKDYDLLRFLRARRWDVAAAVLQYQDTCQWREEHHIDELRAKALGPQGLFSCQELDQETVSALFSGGVEKFPFLRLVNQREDEGAWLFFGMAATWHQKSGHATHVQELQAARMQESSDRMGKRVTQQVVIMDFKGLSFWPDPRAIAVFKDFLMYYPETLAIQFFLNTPPIFMAIWRLIKDWIDPVTAKKMHLLGSDFHSELLEYIHADQLPVEYGGTNPFDVFDWPQNLDEYRRRYALCQRAAEKLPGRSEGEQAISELPESLGCFGTSALCLSDLCPSALREL
eukprot:g32443.t1